jgi:hypothetical protein
VGSNPYIDAREQQFVSFVDTLPRELLQTNAKPLTVLVEELEKSSMVEIGVIRAVTRVDVSDPQAVQTERRNLEDYQQSRLYDRDRTHCSNIDLIAAQLRTPHEDAGAQAKIDELDQVLYPLRDADDDLLGDVEEILDAAVAAIRKIDAAGRLTDAEAERDRFARSMEPRIDRIRSSLNRMHTLRGQLIHLMVGPARDR